MHLSSCLANFDKEIFCDHASYYKIMKIGDLTFSLSHLKISKSMLISFPISCKVLFGFTIISTMLNNLNFVKFYLLGFQVQVVLFIV